MIPLHFAFCHRGLLVNIDRVVAVAPQEAALLDGTCIPIEKKWRKQEYYAKI